MPLARGETFGRYVVHETLGAGGGGQVYRARDTLLNRDVALKVLLEGQGGTEQSTLRVRILREARAAAQLNHPNVIAIFDVGEHDGVPYMAMELVSGRPLRAYIGAPDVSIERRMRWLSDIALGLDAAHKSGLVHRDVKPDNVIVRDDGFIKVLDFGIARNTAVDPRGPTDLQNTETASAGTPHYMAPEQIRSLPLDGRADQFGWGVTAYELLSGGALPWDSSGGALKYVAAVLDLDPSPLADRVATLPSEVALVIDRTLRRSREERFETMEEVARALYPNHPSGVDAVRDVVSATPPPLDLAHQVTTKAPLSEGTAPPGKKPRTLAAVALFAVLAIAGSLVALWRPGGEAAMTAPSSSAPAPAPTPITSLPMPSSPNREALAAYIEGMQAYRDGSGYVALGKLERAANLDPMLAQASLRLALLFIERDAAKAGLAYGHASELRSLLSPRDRGLLDAIEPMASRSGTGSGEATRRLSALEKSYPGDAEVAFYLQLIAGIDGQFALASEAGMRALVIDPEFYAVLASLGEAQAYTGKLDEAVLTFDRCLEKSGGATVCAILRGFVLEQRGECERLGSEARRLSPANPSTEPFYIAQANGMMAGGAPTAAIRLVLDQLISAVPDDRREAKRHSVNFKLDVAVGDFAAAEKDAARYEQSIASDPTAHVHGIAALRVADLYTETGRVKDAGAVAHAMLESLGGWAPETRLEDEGIANDATPSLLAFERAAGSVGESDFVARRGAWLADWEAKAPAFYRGYLWLQAYANTVRAGDDARAALDALERYGAVPPFLPNTAALVGRVYLLADRLDEAMPLLLADAKRCDAVSRPFAHVRALYWLGRGYEAKGDVASACTAYREVLNRWGGAHTRSVTANEARNRSEALRCPRAP